MKKTAFAFLTLLLCSVSIIQLFAQEIATGGPIIEFKKEVHDYGDIKYDGNDYCTFEFTNTGNEPLTISNALKSCGCTIPEYPKESILPGESGTIKVKYDTKRPGVINKSVTIVSNAINEPNKVISIKGRVLPQPESGVPVNQVTPAMR